MIATTWFPYTSELPLVSISTHVLPQGKEGGKMKLLTHNMLTSHVKGVVNGYPLKLIVSEMIHIAVLPFHRLGRSR